MSIQAPLAIREVADDTGDVRTALQTAGGGRERFGHAGGSAPEGSESKPSQTSTAITATEWAPPTNAAVSAAGRRVDGGPSVHVPGLTKVRVACVADVLALLRKGAKNRAVRATEYNQSSSRSHAILQVL